jgi:hypothetical protein
VLADYAAVLAQLDPIGIGADLHRAADSAGRNRVFVVVEARPEQVLDTDAGIAWKPSNGPA